MATHRGPVSVVGEGEGEIAVEDDEDTNLTMCGTANFMAPEIVMQQVHGLAADVWYSSVFFFWFFFGGVERRPRA